MPTYTEILNTQIDQDSPVTQPLLQALRDNPAAMLEGSAGSPLNFYEWHPFDKTTVDGTEDGEIWSFSADGAVSAVTSPDFEDGYEYKFCLDQVYPSGTTNLACNLYRETSAAYSGQFTLVTGLTASIPGSGEVIIRKPRLVRRVHHVIYDVTAHGVTDSTTSTTNSREIRGVAHTTRQKILRAQLTMLSVNITGTADSRIRLMRRRTEEE